MKSLARALAITLPLTLTAIPALADEPSAPPPAQAAHSGVTEQPEAGADLRDLLTLDVGPLALRPVVLMQAQAIPYVGRDSFLQAGDPSERAGFRMRRARFGVEGRLYDRIPFRITAEFS